MKAPVAKKVEHTSSIHGDERTDYYHWMRLSDEKKLDKEPDSQTRDVVDYLEKENEYTQDKLAHLSSLRVDLYDEIVARIKPTDDSVPYLRNGFYYRSE